MKKSIVIALALALCVGFFAGCTETPDKNATDVEVKDEIKVVPEGENKMETKAVMEKSTDGAENLLGYIDPLLVQAVAQGVVKLDVSRVIVENIKSEGSDEAGLAKSVADGIIDEKLAGVLTAMLAQGKQPDLAVANKMEEELIASVGYSPAVGGYPIAGTNITNFYGAVGMLDEPPKPGEDYYGQDAHYQTPCSYTDNGDGTVTDNVTGLIWQKVPGEKKTWMQAVDGLDDFNAQALGGYGDWRIPTMKELYSLVQYTGVHGRTEESSVAFFDPEFFPLTYGSVPGDRMLDSQMLTSTIYDSVAFGSTVVMFGYNFADGRLKGYPVVKRFYVHHVHGNTHYGQNMFVDNGDGTISDLATGLMWTKYDSGHFGAGDAGNGTMDWKAALKYCERMNFAGYNDWRLPNGKELHSIVDYNRSPDTTDSPAIDPLFQSTEITNLAGLKDWGFYWSSSPLLLGSEETSRASVYVMFGRGMGAMGNVAMDVHGAGAQRSDPRTGSRDDFPVNGRGPQGDESRVFNMVRPVRTIK